MSEFATSVTLHVHWFGHTGTTVGVRECSRITCCISYTLADQHVLQVKPCWVPKQRPLCTWSLNIVRCLHHGEEPHKDTVDAPHGVYGTAVPFFVLLRTRRQQLFGTVVLSLRLMLGFYCTVDRYWYHSILPKFLVAATGSKQTQPTAAVKRIAHMYMKRYLLCTCTGELGQWRKQASCPARVVLQGICCANRKNIYIYILHGTITHDSR